MNQSTATADSGRPVKVGDLVTIGHAYNVSAGLRGLRGTVTDIKGEEYTIRREDNGDLCFVQIGFLVEEGAPTEMPDEPMPTVIRWPAVIYLAIGLLATALGILWKLGKLP